MKYVDFNGHRYGIYLTYVNSLLHAVLVENKKKVCNLTTTCYQSRYPELNNGYAYVNVDDVENVEELLNTFGVKRTKRECKVLGKTLVEFNFSSLLRLHNKDLHRDTIKGGMIALSDCNIISSTLVYYACHSKTKNTYKLVTIDGFVYSLTKEKFISIVKEYHIPVYKSFRKEPFTYA